MLHNLGHYDCESVLYVIHPSAACMIVICDGFLLLCPHFLDYLIPVCKLVLSCVLLLLAGLAAILSGTTHRGCMVIYRD